MYSKIDESMRTRVEWRLVEDIFSQWSVLWIGGIAPLSVAAFAYFRTRERFYLGWGIVTIVVLVFRLGVNVAFDRRSDRYSRIDVWRDRFLAGTWLNGGFAGVGAAYAVIGSDQFNKMLMVSLLTAFVLASAARNSLHPRAAAGSILLAVIALYVGCLGSGNMNYLLFGPFIALLTFTAISLVKHLHIRTVHALVTNEEKARLVSMIETSNLELAAANTQLATELATVKRMELELYYAAHHDRLTGLANRASFMEFMELASVRVRNGAQPMFAVMFLDFDRFKLINDTLGHDAGDELLRQIAGRLQSELRASDTCLKRPTGNVVSRFGGDEFLVLVNALDEPEDAVRIAERLLDTLAPAYQIHGTEVHSSASIGIVTSDQCPGPPEDVVRNADVAMFEAKRAGRARAVVFDESMHERLTRHVTIENDLRRAIGSPQLSLLYQPIVDLESGRMVSAEALLRWQHPSLGMVSPAEFIPIAEDLDLIIALGQLVQREACRALVGWMRQDPERAPATISVNVSRAELSRGSRLTKQIRDILEEFGLPANRLQLEVTEREVMRDPEGARAVLLELQSFGVRLAMDDFGTGISSLSLLRDYPFNCIKIDRSFVEGLSSRPDVLAVIHATVNLVENLGMVSVAEGVEETTQVAILQSMGCHCAQGYLFSRPVTADALLLALPQQAQAANSSEVICVT